jgi:hypothetical protein
MKKEMAIDWKLTNPQYAFFTNPAKYRAFISGIGAGKTAIGIMAALKKYVNSTQWLSNKISQCRKYISNRETKGHFYRLLLA